MRRERSGWFMQLCGRTEQEGLRERLEGISEGADAPNDPQALLESEGQVSEEEVVRRLERGLRLNRWEVAKYLRCSTRTVQRLEDRKKLVRCPSITGAVFYAARDVLRLASAKGKKV